MLDGLFKNFDLHLAQPPDIFYGNLQITGNRSRARITGELFGLNLGVVVQD